MRTECDYLSGWIKKQTNKHKWLHTQTSHWDWSTRSQYSDWVRLQVYLQLLSQCGSTCNCLGRSVPEMKWDIKQRTNENSVGWPSGKASAWRVRDPGIKSCLFTIEAYQWLWTDGVVAILLEVWRHIAGTKTGWPGVSMLWLSDTLSLICNFCSSVAAPTIDTSKVAPTQR